LRDKKLAKLIGIHHHLDDCPEGTHGSIPYHVHAPKFGQWRHFGLLMDFINNHERMEEFYTKYGGVEYSKCAVTYYIDAGYIDPDNLADIVLEFFSERER
jgi:predicted membrane-bound spermidine synthase